MSYLVFDNQDRNRIYMSSEPDLVGRAWTTLPWDLCDVEIGKFIQTYVVYRPTVTDANYPSLDAAPRAAAIARLKA